MQDEVLSGYAASCGELIPRFERFSSAELLRHVSDLLPDRPSWIADIGAGTGRDAAWLAQQGHQVVAVEPVAELRRAGMDLHPEPGIEWLDDRLPALSRLRPRGPFDVVLLNGVWHHLEEEERHIAMAAVASTTRRGGLLVMSLRHGPGAKDRPAYPLQADDTIGLAANAGFDLVRRMETDSVQAANRAAGVWWTWLALRRA
ncbi:class I SAM-dependent methyltransferase [Mesorhizobium xinjiangense]|uniref:class I SAM-dependent methyltransferase n=1 Tax=Mesorhizobium xinjiangense TaxID=2678685 RepID=UPI0012ED16EE|nr:class I SAM-dependent methyltransferase [Mesorhizobium xinjiangense]